MEIPVNQASVFCIFYARTGKCLFNKIAHSEWVTGVINACEQLTVGASVLL